MKANLIDPRDSYISSIKLERCKIILKPQIVFICGGGVDIKKPENYSIRNMFMRDANHQNGIDYVLAEDFKDWKEGYSDLSEFENDIASISSLVTIILESAGSIAELGLFYANENIRSKLITVLHTEHYESDSFIKFGLLNPLESLDKRFVLPFNINPRDVENIDKSEISDIIRDIEGYCATVPATQSFHRPDRGHVIFLIYQIVDLLLALTSAEIIHYLKLLNIEFSKSDMKSALFILEKFELVKSIKRSSQIFYVAQSKTAKRVDLKSEKGSDRIDSNAIKIEIGEYYRHSAKDNRSDHNRIRLIETVRTTGAQR